MKEIGLHMSVAAFLRRAWPSELPWTHFPAGEKRETVTRTRRDGTKKTYSPAGAKLKAMGLAPGWPDFLFILPNGQLAGLELKAAAGELSDAQCVVRDQFIAHRCGYATARSLDEVERVLSRWLGMFDMKLKATTGQRAEEFQLQVSA